MLPQLSLFQQCSIESQDVMQTWLRWTRQHAQFVQKDFLALFHPKPNECLHFDLESFNLMCTYTVVTDPCHISPLTQARPMMLCIYTSSDNLCGNASTHNLNQIENVTPIIHTTMLYQYGNNLLAAAVE